MKVLFYTVMSLAVCGLTACGRAQLPQRDVAETPPKSGPPDYNFDANFADVMEFEQGFSHAYNIAQSAHVPAPGQPALTIRDLPDTAKFDGTTLTWTPPCTDAADFYQRGIGVKYVVVHLESSADPTQFIERRVALLVHQFQAFSDRKCGDPNA